MFSDLSTDAIEWLLVCLVILIAAVVVLFVQRADEMKLARRREERKDLILCFLGACLWDHEAALKRRLVQLRYKDAYGNWITDKWEAELKYFLQKNLVEQFPRITEAERTFLMKVLRKRVHELVLDDLPPPDLKALKPSDGIDYERLVGAILAQTGFDVRFTPASGDQGVDLIAERRGVRIAVQCKNYVSAVGNEAVQQVYAGSKFYGAGKAAVVAPNGFTVAARQLAGSL